MLDRIATILTDETGIDVLHPVNPDVIITDHLPFSGTAPTILLGDELNGLEMLKAGASGALPRSIDASDLLLAVETVKRGFAILPRSGIGSDLSPSRDDLLTARELEVLQLLAEGASNKLIAHRLGISFHTAKFHVASIAAKLDATGRTDAVAQALRLGLILL
ncbi:LuxR C-terminal-related transcriptional regulator [Microvirga sp. 2MCAF35]